MLSSQWNSVAVIIILRYASFVTKGSMNVSKCRKALGAISTPRVFPVFVLIYYQIIATIGMV